MQALWREGDAAVLAAAQRFQQGGGEWLSRQSGAWDCSPARPKGRRCQPALTQEGNMPFMEAPRSLACACACACAFSTGRRVTADAELQLFLMAQRSRAQMERNGKGRA